MSEPPPPSDATAGLEASASAADPATPAARAPEVRRRSARRRRRLQALALGLLGPLLAGELTVRVLWSRLAPPLPGADDPVKQVIDPLARGEPLGPALRREALASPTAQLLARPEGARDQCYELDADGVPGLRPGASTWIEVPGTPRYLVHVDRHGLRGPERGPPPPGARSVLVLGDSMTFGVGVGDEETYPALLEPLLDSALASPARVWNGGVTALGPQEELLRLEALLPRLSPDLVLLQLTVANDPLDALRWVDGARPLRPDPDAARALEESAWLANPLARWSRAYRLVAWRFGRHALRYRFMASPAVLDRTVELVARMRERAAPRPFAVLIAPTVVQAEGQLTERLLDTAAINRGLVERLTARGIPCLDPLPALRARSAAGEELYIPVDRHWSPAGHRAVALELAPFLRDLLR